jgi:membrane associated rhomboid family serine protease/ribosomal protein S27AE
MIIPYDTDVRLRYRPNANFGIIGVCVAVYLLGATGMLSDTTQESLVLQDFNPVQLVGSMFLHAGILHLGFNMLYLWIFGNAVCGTIGNWKYLAVYLTGGVAAGVIHLLADGSPAIGASGAINAVLGFYLVLFPVNEIYCGWLFFFKAGSFKIAGYWMILFWTGLDLFNAVMGWNTGVAYWGHVGGFFTGMGMGVLFWERGWVQLQEDDHPSLPDYIRHWLTGREPARLAKPAYTRTELENEKIAAALRQAPRMIKAGNHGCPRCGSVLDVRMDLAGERFHCPSCGSPLEVERPAT